MDMMALRVKELHAPAFRPLALVMVFASLKSNLPKKIPTTSTSCGIAMLRWAVIVMLDTLEQIVLREIVNPALTPSTTMTSQL